MYRLWNAFLGALFNAINPGLQWIGFFSAMDTLFRYAFAGPVFSVDVVTTAALGYTYANGAAGVGATLTKGAAGAFPTTDGVVQFANMLVLVTGEATAARNGYYRLTRPGTSSVAAQLTRVPDFSAQRPGWDASTKIIPGSAFYGSNPSATANSNSAGKVWLYLGAANPIVGTTALTFAPAALLNSAAGASGVPPWAPVRLVTAGALNAYVYATTTQTITFNAAGAQTIDGQVTALGDRIWNNNGAAAADQGPYVVTTKGGAGAEVWTRAPDGNVSNQFTPGKLLESGPDGTANGNAIFELTSAAPITLDTTAITIGAPTNVMNLSGAQTVTGVKSFAQLALATWNAAKTFAASFTFNGVANRTYTLADASGNVLPTATVGTATSVLHGNAAGAGTFSAVDLTADVANVLPIANGGTNAATAAAARTALAAAVVGGTPGGSTGVPSATAAPVFTGTAPLAAENFAAPAFSGTGQASAGQVITTTDNQTMTLNQCAGMWFLSATHGPYMIASNTAVVGAPAVLTVYGTPPTTDAGTYKIIAGLAPVGTVAAVPTAAHTHPAGTLAQV